MSDQPLTKEIHLICPSCESEVLALTPPDPAAYPCPRCRTPMLVLGSATYRDWRRQQKRQECSQ